MLSRHRLVFFMGYKTLTNLAEQADIFASTGHLADASAVAFVAQNEIQRVLEAAESIMERERAMARRLREGTPVGEVMGASPPC